MTILNTAVLQVTSPCEMAELKSYPGTSVLGVHVHECEVCVCRVDVILLL